MAETIIQVWKDVDNALGKKNNGDVVDMVGFDAINNSLTNIFTTFQGSRRMIPTFALPIYRLLFEQIDAQTSSILADLILQAVRLWEPRIIVTGITVDARPDENTYIVTLNYTVVGNSRDQIQTFETVLRVV
jgi:phage baseplate assembly protein W